MRSDSAFYGVEAPADKGENASWKRKLLGFSVEVPDAAGSVLFVGGKRIAGPAVQRQVFVQSACLITLPEKRKP